MPLVAITEALLCVVLACRVQCFVVWSFREVPSQVVAETPFEPQPTS